MLRVVPPGQISIRKGAHKTSEKLMPSKVLPGRFYDGPVVRCFTVVGHEVH